MNPVDLIMAKIESVRMLIGANAYACIRQDDGSQTDIRLSAGKSAQSSLREYARELRADVVRKQNMADLACAAADYLDRELNRPLQVLPGRKVES